MTITCENVRRAAHKALDKLITRAFQDQRLMTGLFDVDIVCNDGDRDEKGVEATYTHFKAELCHHDEHGWQVEEYTTFIVEDYGDRVETSETAILYDVGE